MENKHGISGSTMKMIAIVTMFIDHLGAGVVGRYLTMLMNSGANATYIGPIKCSYEQLVIVYQIMRFTGRIAFPIFCFLLIEGFEHTRNVRKYALRLFGFCVISEIPFDLLFNGQLLETGYQNVFFTLLLGLLTMWAFRSVNQQNWSRSIKVLMDILVLVTGIAAADFLRTDYGGIGIICIMILYITRKSKVTQIVAGCVSFSWEITASLAFIPIGFYNGRRGWNMKYFFYIFYPAHLLLLYGLCEVLGVAAYAAM